MLNHQAEFGIILAEIYDPALAMPSGEATPRRVQTAPESVQAVDDFQAVMREMRDILLPEVVSDYAACSESDRHTVIKIQRQTLLLIFESHAHGYMACMFVGQT